jgi:hypothetical protein
MTRFAINWGHSMAEDKPGTMWDQLVMSQALSPQEKALRDKFVTEYHVDYDGWAAAVRIDFLPSVAVQYAQMLLSEPYVQQEIRRKQMEDNQDTKSATKMRKRQIEAALLREAHRMGPGSNHGARVQALKELAKIHDMEAATKITKEVTHKGGVMMIPAIANIDEWEKAASVEQDKLIASSGEDRQPIKH